MRHVLSAALLVVAGFGIAGCEGHRLHGAHPPSAAANLQGEDPRKFMDNPHLREFYALSVVTLRPGAPALDLKAYEAKSFVLFHAFGESRVKGGGAGMVDHLKLIPAQIVQIVRDDPHVLDSFETFTDAMVGPE